MQMASSGANSLSSTEQQYYREQSKYMSIQVSFQEILQRYAVS